MAANEEVSFLAIIETYAPVPNKRFRWFRSALAWLQRRIYEFAKVIAGEMSLTKFFMERRTVSRIAAFVTRAKRLFFASAAESAAKESPGEDFERWLWFDYLAPAAKKYQLKVFPGRIHLFRASNEPKTLFIDDLLGWGAFAALLFQRPT